jgi:uncharacterized protein YwgA
MMDAPERAVAEIVLAAGGRLVSRVRLQKIAYLLDRLGAGSGFQYSYYHYGPYSSGFDLALRDAEASGLVTESFGRRELDGARYSIFHTPEDADQAAAGFSCLRDEKLRDWAKRLARENITVLELAATANWLIETEKVADWRREIVRRKGTKTGQGRLQEAENLLTELGLPPMAKSS